MGFQIDQYTKCKLWLVLMVFYNGFSSNGFFSNVDGRPEVVNIGALLCFDSAICQVAKTAVETAVKDVNSDPSVLGGTKLQLSMQDSNYSGYSDALKALKLIGSEVVAIIGPQFSTNVHVVLPIADEHQVPLLSFAATDPTLSSLQYPFFVRTTQSDIFQMAAISEIIEYYKWRLVIAIYVDDDYGRNGVAALGDKLTEKNCKILYKAPLIPKRNSSNEILDLLERIALMESRIIVLLTYSDCGQQVLSVARKLGMVSTGYVWLVTDWLSTIIDTYSPLPSRQMDDIQGVLTLRIHTPDSELKNIFTSRWGNLTIGTEAGETFRLNTYGLYAYDTVWLLAYAMEAFFNQGGNISFSYDPRLTELQRDILRADALKVFNGGNLLLQSILQVNFTGVTGSIKFANRNLIHPSYEVINVIGTGYRRVGYWSNYSGLSIVPPDYISPSNHADLSQQLHGVIWPGETVLKPRGWVAPNDGRHWRIGVPNRVFYLEFVSVDDTNDIVNGYCIDLFTATVNLLPYALSYKLIPFGDGLTNPDSNELLRMVSTGIFDIAVGDISITTEREGMVHFMQPYMKSGLVVVVPVRNLNPSGWAFLRPFTPIMWLVTTVFFLSVGVLIWFLEHRVNDDFRGPPGRQIVTILSFSFSTLVYAHKEKIKGTLSRLVLIIWLFAVLVLSSSYTASLTSILTVERLSSIKGIESLISTNEPVGYQQGSFVRNYLISVYNIDKSRLVPLNSEQEYAKALKDGPKNGGVAAIVDEKPYMEIFLSSHSEFTIVGQEFSRNGWGFAFQGRTPLAEDMSTAFTELSENGDLQRIHDKWFSVSVRVRESEDGNEDPNRLHLGSFRGLFLICGIACLLTLILYLMQLLWKFKYYCSKKRENGYAHFRKFISFVDKRENDANSQSKEREIDQKASDPSINGNALIRNSSSEIHNSDIQV